MIKGEVVAVCTSSEKGVPKEAVGSAKFVANWGIDGDAHAGDWHRQVSLLAEESIAKMKDKGLELSAGSFAENVITREIDLVTLPIGTKLQIGEALVEVTQIGKKCHDKCAIYEQVGDCIMPREGIFVKVLNGGQVGEGDNITG